MRKVNTQLVKEHIKEMFISMNYELEDDITQAIKKAEETEVSSLGKKVLNTLQENLCIAKEKNIPICQDTGMAVVFIEVGQNVILEGDYIKDAINEGVREAYEEGYLRKSVVADPLRRENTKDNTPAIIHFEIVEGDQVKITAAAKGFGSENMSQVKMLKPSQGRKGVIDFIVKAVEDAGPNPCPPIVVGVGVGGTMEKATIMAKKALTRPIGENNKDTYIEAIEKEALEKINQLGIGPQGFGGINTAFAVNIDHYPTHIAGLPVAVNINCHVSRHKEVII